MESCDAIILGGGVSGLAAAFELKRLGMGPLRVVEARERVGGVIHSEYRDGFLAEAGANEMLLRSERVAQLIGELGLYDQVLEAGELGKKRYLVRGGRLVALPSGLLSALTTPVLSTLAKLRLLREPFVSKGEGGGESVASFARRRLGREACDYGFAPLVSGIFAGDAERLSLRHAFPKLHAFEQARGSIIRGAMAASREGKAQGIPRPKRRLIAFRDGMSTLPQALAGELADALTLDAEAERVERVASLWEVALRDGRQLRAPALILALPAHRLGELRVPSTLAPGVSTLAETPYASVVVVTLGYKREQVRHPLDGFGFLCPPNEDRKVLGTLFSSSLFSGRAPEGHVALQSFVGGARDPSAVDLDEVALLHRVQGELSALLGVDGEPVFRRIVRWRHAIPQYNLGHERFHEAADRILAANPGLALASNYLNGVSVGDAVESGLDAAARIHSFLTEKVYE